MASSLILDLADPGVREMVAAWKVGGRYTLEVEVVQASAGEKQVMFTVQSATPLGEAEPEEEEVPPTTEKAPAKSKGGPKPVKMAPY